MELPAPRLFIYEISFLLLGAANSIGFSLDFPKNLNLLPVALEGGLYAIGHKAPTYRVRWLYLFHLLISELNFSFYYKN